MQKEKLGVFPYVLGGLSFIPLVGVLFGIVTIVWGMVTEKRGGKVLAFIGARGILSTIIIYSSLFYFGFQQKDGVFDDLRQNMAKSNLVQVVQAIEFYKVQKGSYPDSLDTLKESLPKNSMVFVFDVTDMSSEGKPRNYHYELIDDSSYYLLGVGVDGKPFTADDIVPEVEVSEGSKVGLKVDFNGTK